MSTYLLGRLALATVPALIMLTAMTASPAAAVVNIDACQTLDQFGETYRVTQDLSSCDACLIVANDRITIDLQGHQIAGGCPGDNFGAGITDARVARDSITVKNGTVSFYDFGFDIDLGFGFGIDLRASRRTTVRNVEASANVTGIAVGSQSLVKDCHVHHNAGFGITGSDRVQIQGCRVSENGNGISVGGQCLITRNDVSKNLIHGIEGGQRCTVSFNQANENGAVGILALVGESLVTSNVANNNNVVGISVICPATVMNNTATGNGLQNYQFVVFMGDDCDTNNNKE